MITYEEFEIAIFQLTGIDLQLYKEKQMKRRLNTLIERLGLDSYESYLALLRSDSKSLEHFLRYITINVTEFFRTQDQWNYMADHILASLPDNAVVWSCACSTGEEPYSLAISIALRRPLANIRIIATDIDDNVLDIARRGEYTSKTMDNVLAESVDRYFTKTENGYRVNEDIRSHVEFRHLNLLADPFPQDCDLIVCRNVLIYFTDKAKNMLYKEFHDSLRPGGHLFTGNTEQLLRCRELGFVKETGFLYRKAM